MDDLFRISGTDLVILLPMEVDHYNTEKVRKQADLLMQKNNIKRIVFDFRKTVFMDSSGIGMILGRYKNLQFMGGTVMAVGVNERIRRILVMSGVSKVLEICEDVPQKWETV